MTVKYCEICYYQSNTSSDLYEGSYSDGCLVICAGLPSSKDRRHSSRLGV
jgi:hypothetical protein